MTESPPTLSPVHSLPPLLSGDLLSLFRKASEEGPVVRLDGAFFRLYQVNDTSLIEDILRDKQKVYRKGKLMRSLSVVTGDGLLINDGDVWKRHRRLANPAFSPRKLDGYAECMMRSASLLIERWKEHPADTPIDLLEEMSEVTLMSLLQTIFGIDFDAAYAEVSHVIHSLLEAVVRRGRSFFPLPLSFPTPANIDFRAQITKANRILEDIMATRRETIQDEDAPVDLLGQWLQQMDAQDEDSSFTPSEMRDELMTMLIAGHHSLAIALAWSLYETARAPAVQQALHQEIDGLETFPSTHQALEQLPYTRGIFLEALRLYPQPPILLRDALEEHQLGPYTIRKGDQLLVNVLAVHQHPERWPSPETFDPSRYTDLPIEASLQHHYLSFGGGSRTCIGRRFAILEGCMLLARIAQEFELSLDSSEPIPPRFAAMMVPSSPLTLKVTPRR